MTPTSPLLHRHLNLRNIRLVILPHRLRAVQIQLPDRPFNLVSALRRLLHPPAVPSYRQPLRISLPPNRKKPTLNNRESSVRADTRTELFSFIPANSSSRPRPGTSPGETRSLRFLARPSHPSAPARHGYSPSPRRVQNPVLRLPIFCPPVTASSRPEGNTCFTVPGDTNEMNHLPHTPGEGGYPPHPNRRVKRLLHSAHPLRLLHLLRRVLLRDLHVLQVLLHRQLLERVQVFLRLAVLLQRQRRLHRVYHLQLFHGVRLVGPALILARHLL